MFLFFKTIIYNLYSVMMLISTCMCARSSNKRAILLAAPPDLMFICHDLYSVSAFFTTMLISQVFLCIRI